MRKEAVPSSQIEGTQSSLSDLLLFELDEAPSVPFDDVVEVSNYVAALEHGLARLRAGFPFSNRLIREVHGTLLSRGRGQSKLPGEFRRSQNWIGGDRPGNAHFVPPPHQQVEELMAKLEQFLHDQPSRTPTLLKAVLAHVQFETIHPFLDDNGRVGRLLIPMLLCIEGVLREPLLYLSLYFKQNRSRYYEMLDRVRTEGQWEEWAGQARVFATTGPNQVWGYDFTFDRCGNGQSLKSLSVVDEWTRECLAIEVGSSITAVRVIAVLERLFQQYGAPQVLRSDNGPEFIARALKVWTLLNHSEMATIDPGKPWQNGSVESFHATFRRECLDAEYFAHLREAKILIEQWRWEYNTQRPHSSLGYRSPAEVGAEARTAMKSQSKAIAVGRTTEAFPTAWSRRRSMRPCPPRVTRQVQTDARIDPAPSLLISGRGGQLLALQLQYRRHGGGEHEPQSGVRAPVHLDGVLVHAGDSRAEVLHGAERMPALDELVSHGPGMELQSELRAE